MSDIVVGGMALVGVLVIVVAARGAGRRQGARREGDDAPVGVMASDGGLCGDGGGGDSGGDCGGGDGGGGGD